MGHEKPELSKKSKYWIPKERYYELLHFCRQYDDFKAERDSIFMTYPQLNTEQPQIVSETARPTEANIERVAKLQNYIRMIQTCALRAEPSLAGFILLGVTKGYSYGYLSTTLQMPAGKDMYYDRYRKFFYLLSQLR